MAKRLLLCDDEVHILRAAEIKLTRAGFEVRCAHDGQEAWEQILAEPPDLLITDLQMPRMDGLELIRRIRAHQPTQGLPAILLTAKGLEIPQAQIERELGVVAVLSKPFSPRELVQRACVILGIAPPPARLAEARGY